MKLNRVLYPNLFSYVDTIDMKPKKRKYVIIFEECAYCEKFYVTTFAKKGLRYQYSVQPDATLDITTEVCCCFSIEDQKRYEISQPDCFEYIDCNGIKGTRDTTFKVWECPDCGNIYLEITNKKGNHNVYFLKEGKLLYVTSATKFECCYCGSSCSI